MYRRKLFEIPIYSTSSERFYKYWDNKLEEQTKLNCRHAGEESLIRESIRDQFYPLRLWEYNEIIGYIQISLTRNDIVFEVYLSDKDRVQLLSSRKPRIRPLSINGCHFFIEDSFTNKEISDRIIKWLEFVQKNHIPKGRFIDREAFDTLVYHVDYKAILKKIQGGT